MNTITGGFPGLVLPELAECIVNQLADVALCSISSAVIPDTGGAPIGVLLAAFGPGAAVAAEHPIMRVRRSGSAAAGASGSVNSDFGSSCNTPSLGAGGGAGDWSVLRLHGSPGRAVLRWDADEAAAPGYQGPPPPQDFDLLARRGGMKSFMAVPVAAGARVLGALTVASPRAGAFGAWSWEPTLGMAAAALLPHLLNPQLSDLCNLLVKVGAEHDAVRATSTLIQGLARFMHQATNVRMSIRLGLIRSDRLLLVESQPLPRIMSRDVERVREHAGGANGVSGGSSGGGGGRSRVVLTELPLANTLLGSAATAHTARFISDCALYLQGAPQPAPDVFTPGSRLVSALVVVPLLRGAGAGRPAARASSSAGGGGSSPPVGPRLSNGSNPGAVGGLYFALEAPDGCAHLQAPILAATGLVSTLLARQLSGHYDALKSRAPADSAWSLSSSCAGSSFRGAPGPAGASTGGGGPLFHGSGPGGAAAAANGGAAAGASQQDQSQSDAPSVGGGGPPCTEAILKAVQQKLSVSHSSFNGALDPDPSRRLDGLVLKSVIGRGGYGVCYRGTYKGTPVAVKVLYASDPRSALKDAMEMGVLLHLRHPGVVAVYDCITDLVEVAPGRSESSTAPLPRYRAAAADDEPGSTVCNMIVMEYCDLGTLRDAIKRGALHRKLSQSMAAVDLGRVLKVLLEVARSVEYMHERQLLHCDIKMDNVLLKSDPTREMGFCCKLADFGLSKMLNEKHYVNNRSGSGTITHVAPEMLMPNAKLTKAVDAYSFGILIYEVYTGRRVYAGLSRGEVLERLTRGGRPAFPAAAPPRLEALAQLCWAEEAAHRPAFSTVCSVLEELEAEEAAAAAAPGGGGSLPGHQEQSGNQGPQFAPAPQQLERQRSGRGGEQQQQQQQEQAVAGPGGERQGPRQQQQQQRWEQPYQQQQAALQFIPLMRGPPPLEQPPHQQQQQLQQQPQPWQPPQQGEAAPGDVAAALMQLLHDQPTPSAPLTSGPLVLRGAD